jgi:isopentenyldiphosphate isomerase
VETWDVLDSSKQLTGRVAERTLVLPEGDWHLVVVVCLFNADGERALQLRSRSKTVFGGFWDWSVGGAVWAGETSQAAAEREAREELGLDLDFSSAVPEFTVAEQDTFFDFYMVTLPPTDVVLRPAPGEVDEVRWCSLELALDLLASGEFVPTAPEFLELVYAIGRFPQANWFTPTRQVARRMGRLRAPGAGLG